MKRYYFGRGKAELMWQVQDRKLKMKIASCLYREQATLITEALNEYDAKRDVPTLPDPAVDSPRGQRPLGGSDGDREDPFSGDTRRYRS